MILYEFEGKKLLQEGEINIPSFQIVNSLKDKPKVKFPLVLKAQVLSGKRKDAGGIVFIDDSSGWEPALKKLLGVNINREEVKEVLAEEMIDNTREFYASISYDTANRSPIITFSEAGGTGIEERKVETIPVDILNYEKTKVNLPSEIQKIIPKLLKLFFESDMTLLEINPLVIDNKGKVWALDAKVKLDDTAGARHPEWKFGPREVPGHTPTKGEILAKKIDEGDYRGTAGSTYLDLSGDIAVLASGGGASLTAMDALLKSGGKPANYTEYSGNPPKEKVEKLTSIVLSKEGLHGLWVVGAIANFTDIYETLSGFLEALRKINPKPTYPIVIRRGGPKDKQAFEMLREIKDFNLHLYGEEISITESAKIVVDLANKYATTNK